MPGLRGAAGREDGGVGYLNQVEPHADSPLSMIPKPASRKGYGRMRSLPLIAIMLAGLGACAVPAEQVALPRPGGPAAATGPADCAAAVFPDDRFISDWGTDRYTGRCRYGSQQTDVWREGQRMFVGTRGGERRQIRLSPEVVGESVFSDGCRTHYYFNLSPDGHGALMQIVEQNGVQRVWERRSDP